MNSKEPLSAQHEYNRFVPKRSEWRTGVCSCSCDISIYDEQDRVRASHESLPSDLFWVWRSRKVITAMSQVIKVMTSQKSPQVGINTTSTILSASDMWLIMAELVFGSNVAVCAHATYVFKLCVNLFLTDSVVLLIQGFHDYIYFCLGFFFIFIKIKCM